MSDLKIAYVTSEYPAVSHTFVLREVAALRALGLDVATVSMRSADLTKFRGTAEQDEARSTYYVIAAAKQGGPLLAALGAALARPGRLAKVIALAWRTRGPGLKALIWQLFYVLEALILARHLRAIGATQIHNHFAKNSATVAMLAAELTGISFSLTIHGPSDFAEAKLWHMGEKVARARFVACISHFARSQVMLHSAPAHWDRLRIIHCGVDPSLYGAGARDDAEMVFVGRLAAAKGLPVLIEAMKRVAQTRPDLRLTVVGDGPDRAALEQAAAPLGDAVRFTGVRSQDEVAEILRGAALFVLPSFAEGVPVVLMEAMASHLPVIATRIAGIAELVEDGAVGRIIAPGDPEALAEAILALMAPETDRAALGAAGAATVAAEFTIAGEAARLARLFREGPGDQIRPDP